MTAGPSRVDLGVTPRLGGGEGPSIREASRDSVGSAPAPASSPAPFPLGVSQGVLTPAGRGAGGKAGLWHPGAAPGRELARRCQ